MNKKLDIILFMLDLFPINEGKELMNTFLTESNAELANELPLVDGCVFISSTFRKVEDPDRFKLDVE
jgi:hypothetical protein